MELILIRHAPTAGNLMGRYIGATDEPLSDEGRRRAAAAAVPDFNGTVYSSHMRRAAETAKLLFPSAVIEMVAGLCEMNFGDFENRSADEMENDFAYRMWVKQGCTGPCPNGESPDQFKERTTKALSASLENAMGRNAGLYIAVLHGGVIMAAMERFCSMPGSYFEWSVPPLAGWRADVFWDSETSLPRFYNPIRFEEGRLCL